MLAKIGTYLIHRRYQTIGIAFVAALLPFLGLATAWISILLIALVTLIKGAKEGFLVMIWVALPALALFIDGDSSLLIDMIVFRVVVVWLLALLLRYRASWALTLQSVALLSSLIIAILHLHHPNIAGWWEEQLSNYWLNLTH